MSKKALGLNQFLQMKFRVMNFEGQWEASFGKPEMTGCWIIYGDSGSGKTSLAVKLAKYLTKFGRVAYNSLEQGFSLSLQRAFRETFGEKDNNRLLILHKEPMGDIEKRLKGQRSPDIVIVDSIQFTGESYMELKEVIDRNPRKLFIFVSHAEGSNPSGAAAKAIEYLSDIKIYVQGFKTYPKSRFGGGDEFVIYEEGAAKMEM